MEINKLSIGQTNCDLTNKTNQSSTQLSYKVSTAWTRYYLVQFTNFSHQRLLTIDAMTGRIGVCGEQRGAGTDCVHHQEHGDARDLLPVPSRLQQQRVCSRGREQKPVLENVADNIAIFHLFHDNFV